MPESKLADHVQTLRNYLGTPEGRREVKRLSLCFGLSYQQALAQKAVCVCGLTHYEDIAAVVDGVLLAELAA